MEENSPALFVSAVTVAEIEDGIAKLRREKAGRKVAALSAWLEAVLHLYGERVLSFGLQEARIAGALSDGARAKGRSPGFADIIIAATASAHNLILLTRNERHFKPLGVKTINPFDNNREGATTPMNKKKGSADEPSPSHLIDARIEELGDWRGETLARVRKLIRQADPEVVETWKWRGVPVWEHDGIICTGETYKSVVKMTFAKGAALKDPSRLFNSSLEGNTRRAIDFAEGAKINDKALKALIRAAVALNTSARPAARRSRAPKE
jgi:predicted nucleic acid-binding protein